MIAFEQSRPLSPPPRRGGELGAFPPEGTCPQRIQAARFGVWQLCGVMEQEREGAWLGPVVKSAPVGLPDLQRPDPSS